MFAAHVLQFPCLKNDINSPLSYSSTLEILPHASIQVSLIELGDLHSNNTRQVLMRVAVSTQLSSTEEQQVLEYELQYCSVDSTDGGREALRGRAVVACTDSPEEAAQQNPEVLTAIAIQAAVRHDFEAATALEDGEIDIALSAKRASIAVLELALQKLNGQAALVRP